MNLHPDCLAALKYPTFWEDTNNPSLRKFLDFRRLEGDLADSDTEHYRYQCELDAFRKYYTEESEVDQIVLKLKKWVEVVCLHGLLCGWYACKGKVECSVRSSFWVEGSYGQLVGGMLTRKSVECSSIVVEINKTLLEFTRHCTESGLVDEKSKLQWKEGMFEFERTGFCHLRETSSSVQEKQISSYTFYKGSEIQTNDVSLVK
ncbi:18817_t:CDS:2, partial [Acaulospora morrowiae]